jgi:hypothetical protein
MNRIVVLEEAELIVSMMIWPFESEVLRRTMQHGWAVASASAVSAPTYAVSGAGDEKYLPLT